jgi:hypothetical protein
LCRPGQKLSVFSFLLFSPSFNCMSPAPVSIRKASCWA